MENGELKLRKRTEVHLKQVLHERTLTVRLHVRMPLPAQTRRRGRLWVMNAISMLKGYGGPRAKSMRVRAFAPSNCVHVERRFGGASAALPLLA